MGESHPWEADHALTDAQVRGAIASNFPDVDASKVEHIGSGWEFDAYLTPDHWVFRFPRKVDGAQLFGWERRVQELVASRVRTFAVGLITREGAPSEHFPYAFAGYRYLPGVRADQAPSLSVRQLAPRVGRALTEIHSIPVADAAAIGADRDLEGGADWLEEARALAPNLEGLGPHVDRALAWLVRATPPEPYNGPLRFIHNDLAPDHLIVDPDTGDLVGIIDWTDAAIADPVLDFIVMRCWLGSRFVDAILDGYELPIDTGFSDRLAFIARTLSLIWLWEGVQQNGDMEKHLGWVRNAHEDAREDGGASEGSTGHTPSLDG